MPFALDSAFEPAMLEHIAWADSASSRVRLVLVWAADPYLKLKLSLLAVLNDPIRIVHRIFIRGSSQGSWRAVDRPQLLGFTNKRCSPVLAAEQYCGSLLLPRPRRHLLLAEGCSLLAWKLGVPDAPAAQQALDLRRGVLLVESWAWRRHEIFD